MVKDDRLFTTRVALFGRVGEVGVTEACRQFQVHRSTYYRWKASVGRHGLEILRPRERRLPRMPNQTPPWLEDRIIGFVLGHPGLGPRRVAAQLALPMWGSLQISATGVYKVLIRRGLNTRRRRLGIVAGYAAPPEPEPAPTRISLHLEAAEPGDLVQLDCFHIGRLSGTEGKIWQYTAIDVASSYVWAQGSAPRPAPVHISVARIDAPQCQSTLPARPALKEPSRSQQSKLPGQGDRIQQAHVLIAVDEVQ
jgi:Helix-turn-helix domain